MAIITLSFDNMNTSVQVGDIAYYSYNTEQNYLNSGFDHSTLSTTKKLGEIVGGNSVGVPVTGNSITVQYDNAIVSAPPTSAFISLAKDKKVNTSSLLGYYADVKFVNNSTKKAELFSVSSEVTESSK